MGLIKKDGDLVKGVLIKPSYAKITSLHYYSPNMEQSYAMFGISTTRDNLDNGLFLEERIVRCDFNRTEDNLFNEAYNQAKQTTFIGWEDDIITPTEESIEE